MSKEPNTWIDFRELEIGDWFLEPDNKWVCLCIEDPTGERNYLVAYGDGSVISIETVLKEKLKLNGLIFYLGSDMFSKIENELKAGKLKSIPPF